MYGGRGCKGVITPKKLILETFKILNIDIVPPPSFKLNTLDKIFVVFSNVYGTERGRVDRHGLVRCW